MAIDNREKRQAAASITYIIGANVTPNASPDQEWRQEAGWGYPGILVGAGGPAAAGQLPPVPVRMGLGLGLS